MYRCREIRVLSFGYKHGDPPRADLLFNVRFAANPFHQKGLANLDGRDPRVREFVLAQPAIQRSLPAFLLAARAFVRECVVSGSDNFQIVTIAVGCAGGRQRSVAIAEELAAAIADELAQVEPAVPPLPQVTVHHRDLNHDAQTSLLHTVVVPAEIH